MAGSDPAGRPLRARLGHRQRPQGPSLYLDRSQSRRNAATPGASSGSRSPRGCAVGNRSWRSGVDSTKVVSGGSVTRDRLQLNSGDERFRLRWLILEKRAEGGGRNLVKMRPQNTSANSTSTVKAPRATFALAA